MQGVKWNGICNVFKIYLLVNQKNATVNITPFILTIEEFKSLFNAHLFSGEF